MTTFFYENKTRANKTKQIPEKSVTFWPILYKTEQGDVRTLAPHAAYRSIRYR